MAPPELQTLSPKRFQGNLLSINGQPTTNSSQIKTVWDAEAHFPRTKFISHARQGQVIRFSGSRIRNNSAKFIVNSD
jgi:hypothetical protein